MSKLSIILAALAVFFLALGGVFHDSGFQGCAAAAAVIGISLIVMALVAYLDGY